MSKTRTGLLLAAFTVSCAALLGLAACGGSSSSAAGSSASTAASTSASAASASTDAASSAAASAASAASSETATAAASSAASAESSAGLTADDLANVDITIALDDYDAMKELSKDIQNGRATDKVVQIDGYVSNFAKGMSYNIVENNADKSGNIGTKFVIEGVDEDAYPSDETHVILTGKVVAESNINFDIHTLPEYVQVVE